MMSRGLGIDRKVVAERHSTRLFSSIYSALGFARAKACDLCSLFCLMSLKSLFVAVPLSRTVIVYTVLVFSVSYPNIRSLFSVPARMFYMNSNFVPRRRGGSGR